MQKDADCHLWNDECRRDKIVIVDAAQDDKMTDALELELKEGIFKEKFR